MGWRRTPVASVIGVSWVVLLATLHPTHFILRCPVGYPWAGGGGCSGAQAPPSAIVLRYTSSKMSISLLSRCMQPAQVYFPFNDQTDPSNYSGISLLSSISKLFEKLISHRLEELQSTFKEALGRVCILRLFFRSQWPHSERRRKHNNVARKAFDTVWHPG